MESLVGNLTFEIIDLIHCEYTKDENKKKVENIVNDLLYIILDKIQPYFITIVVILSLMFLMNTAQFYYYIKLFLKNNQV